jgi:hypothetical protein
MEIRLNLVLLGVLGLTWLAMTPADPVAALDPDAAETRELALLEDQFAASPNDVLLARHLSSRYLELDRPGLAIAALRSADPTLLEDPTVAHRLAQAYERTGRMLDAVATAELAVARCGRYLGTTDAAPVTPVPEYVCDERDYALLDLHRNALSHMVRWGVSDPGRDPRRNVAYQIAERRVSIARAE